MKESFNFLLIAFSISKKFLWTSSSENLKEISASLPILSHLTQSVFLLRWCSPEGRKVRCRF